VAQLVAQNVNTIAHESIHIVVTQEAHLVHSKYDGMLVFVLFYFSIPNCFELCFHFIAKMILG
jgi:hypothetical protein